MVFYQVFKGCFLSVRLDTKKVFKAMKCVTTHLFISLLRAVNAKFRSNKLPQLHEQDLCEGT